MSHRHWKPVLATLGTGLFLGCLATVGPRDPHEMLHEEATGVAIPSSFLRTPHVQDPPPTTPRTDAAGTMEDAAPAPSPQDPARVEFLPTAFPPTVPDTAWHRDAWWKDDCLRCHETGVGEAPQLVHADMPPILLTAKCRSCHVVLPGSKPRARTPVPSRFEPNAFPPMIPASARHRDAWNVDDCLLCHDESRIGGAPQVRHEGMPPILLQAKCRTCHVQVRTVEVMRPGQIR